MKKYPIKFGGDVSWIGNEWSLANITYYNDVGEVITNTKFATHYSLAEGVTTFPDDAFYFCIYLQAIKLPDEINSLGDSCFRSCYSLSKISIPKNIKTIGQYCFGTCTALAEVYIEEGGVTIIPNNSFQMCEVHTFEIPEGVTAIGETAFAHSDIVNLIIPSSVKNIGAFGEVNFASILTTPTNVGSLQTIVNTYNSDKVDLVAAYYPPAIEPKTFVNGKKVASIYKNNEVISNLYKEGELYFEDSSGNTIKGTVRTEYTNQTISYIGIDGQFDKIDWGDGTITTDTKSHVYYNPGVYNITINSGDNDLSLRWFAYLISVSEVKTKQTSLNGLFYGCTSLLSVPYFITSNVVDMSYMFSMCGLLTSVPYYNTENVTNMEGMFEGCTLYNSPSQFNTSNVTNMESMFEDCRMLSSVPFNKTRVSNVINMSRLFYGCTSLTTIPEDLDLSSVTNMSNMFRGCTALTSVPLLNTSKVTDMSYMFRDCTALTSIPLLDTSNVTNMSYMFSGTYRLTTVPLLNTSNVTDMSYMFYDSILTSLPTLDTSNVTNMQGAFSRCSELVNFPQLNTSKAVNVSELFYDSNNLASLPLLNFSSVEEADRLITSNDLTHAGGFTGLKVSTMIMSPLTSSSWTAVFNSLATVAAGSESIALGGYMSTISESIKAIATNKGWQIVPIY